MNEMDSSEEIEDANQDEHLNVTAEAVNVAETSVGKVVADLVRINSSYADQITASEIEMRQSAARVVKTDDCLMNSSAAVSVQATTIKAEQCAIGMAEAEQTSLYESPAALVRAQTVQVDQSKIGIVIAQEVKGSTIQTGILLTRNVNGYVQTFLDTPRALLTGIVAGVVTGLVLFGLRIVSGKESV